MAIDKPVVAGILGISAACFFLAGWLRPLDNLIYDWQIRQWQRPPHEDIRIVAVDEPSLANLGRWPWPRSVHPKLIDALSAAGAKAIALDIAFAEPDFERPRDDDALARAAAESRRLILPVLNEQSIPLGYPLETLPFPALSQVAAGLGHVDIETDDEGIARSTYLLAGIGSPRWPTLTLAMLRLADPKRWRAVPAEPESAQGRSPYHWTRSHHVLIPFAGPPGWFPRLSYVDVLTDPEVALQLRDKYVLVGLTASGVGTALATPVSGRGQPMSGVEFHANILDSLLRGLLITEVKPLTVAFWLGFMTMLAALVQMRLPGYWEVTFATCIAVLLANAWFLRVQHLWVPPAAMLAGTLLGYPLSLLLLRRQEARTAFHEKERAQVTLRSIGDGVISSRSTGEIEYMNPTAETLTGYALEEVQGKPLDFVFRIADGNRSLSQNLANGEYSAPQLETLVGRTGQTHTVRVFASRLHDQQGAISGIVITLSDISRERQLTQIMVHQATHDPLTGLPNRILFNDRLGAAIAQASRQGNHVAVLFVDLDRFKMVNNGLGHGAGDHMLRTVTARLAGVTRASDTLARLGGDEFALCLVGLSDAALASLVADKILKTVALPQAVEQVEVALTASVGISLFPEDGKDAEALVKHAEVAMYRAKEDGGNNFQYAAMDMNMSALDRLVLEGYLRQAVEQEKMELYYQPLTDLASSDTCGFESLLRWPDAPFGEVPPSVFIPLAEESGLILPLGDWVMRTACRQASAWHEAGKAPVQIAVNLSPRQFQHRDLIEFVRLNLEQGGLPPEQLTLEITESMIMKDVDSAIGLMKNLKAMGTQIAIDDFGTGYSSLNYLKQFPIDRLKIDKSFVRNIPHDPDDCAIARSIIAMAHHLKLKVTAEGVETEEQLDFLRDAECDCVQGYLIARPLNRKDAGDFLRCPSPVRKSVAKAGRSLAG